jgi:hypothetical protein
MKRRSIATAGIVIVVAVVMWLGGHALWNAVLAMHGRR